MLRPLIEQKLSFVLFLQTKGIRFHQRVPALIVVIDRYHSGHLSAFSLAFVISYEPELVV